jgi:hypothetical protein
MNLNLNDTSSALCDIYDIKRALSKQIKKQPKDNDGTEITIGDCIDDLVLFLEGIYEQGHEDQNQQPAREQNVYLRSALKNLVLSADRYVERGSHLGSDGLITHLSLDVQFAKGILKATNPKKETTQ